MQSLARNGYTAEQVKNQLHAANRVIAFRYELLDNQNKKLGQLDNILAASVSHNSLAEIKRTARFTLKDTGEINFLSDRIKPWVRLKMPDGGWVEWPQGVFLLSTPPRKINSAGVIIREVEAYDLLQILIADKTTDRYCITAGTNYITELKNILDSSGLTQQNLTPSDKTLPSDREWDPVSKKISVGNDILSAVNYRSLSIDENGTAVAQPYVSPVVRASEYVYTDDDQSVIFPEVEQGLDLFSVPNKWIAIESEADQIPLISSYTNSNPNSPTSTVSRGWTFVADPVQVEAADQSSLDAIVQRKAYEDSQIYEQVTFQTAIMPFHSDSDVITLNFSKLGIGYKYSEVSWSFELKAGAKMKHSIRRVVEI